MHSPLSCAIFSSDTETVERIRARLGPTADVHAFGIRDVNALLRHAPRLVFVDLKTPDALAVMAMMVRQAPGTLFSALGSRGSDAARVAEALGAFSVEEPGVEAERLQALARQAARLADALDEVQWLKDRLNQKETRTTDDGRDAARASDPWAAPPSDFLARTARHLGDVEAMFEYVVEGVSAGAGVCRVGVFTLSEGGEAFRFRSGKKCPEGVQERLFASDDALVLWLTHHAAPVCRWALPQIENHREAMALKRALDEMGADVVLPLFGGRGRLLGWLFAAGRYSGAPIQARDMDALAMHAECAGAAVENLRAYEDTQARQDALLSSVPVGIVAVDAGGAVAWINGSAADMLDTTPAAAMHRPLPAWLGDRLAAYLRGKESETIDIDHPGTRHPLEVQMRQLERDGRPVGAMAVIRDLTQDQYSRAEKSREPRRRFWHGFAEAMEDEILNGLQAVQTFPERFLSGDYKNRLQQAKEDAEQAIGQIDQLVQRVRRLAGFGRQGARQFEPLSPSDMLTEAVDAVRRQRPDVAGCIRTAIPPDLPPVRADRRGLVEFGFKPILENAVEAVLELKPEREPDILVSAEVTGSRNDLVTIRVKDNGKGIPEEIRDDIFTPWTTTKRHTSGRVGHFGLGLASAYRTVTDHGGRISVAETGENGTTVCVTMPVRGLTNP
jgi:signal transduction histidine kinase